jgi:DNA-binding MarR family transcriptional regulator
MSDSLDRDLVVLLYDVARIMRTKFDQRARAREMTRAQWHILARVERQPGLSQSELAAICEVEPITVARLVDRLEKRGLLERRADPTDRRIWRLHNLPTARPILDEINAYREQLIRDIDGQIGQDTREAMVDSLLAIRAQLSAGTEQTEVTERAEPGAQARAATGTRRAAGGQERPRDTGRAGRNSRRR